MKKIRNYLIIVCLTLPVFCSSAQDQLTITLTINAKNTAQTIQNIGASGCWYSESIGKYWPLAKRGRMAELLFSKEALPNGTPKGIGLSAWRFNIGGGTTEQGDSSGIRNAQQRIECFLSPDGTYNWNKQAGYQWFLQKAKDYKVENLIAFSNTPPVQFTQNGYAFKTSANHKTNLKAESYIAYADFLSQVMKHFDSKGLHFNYLSPVNEPQWDWSGKPGQAVQEGTSWGNAEIYQVVTALNKSLDRNKLTTQILTPEAGDLTYLYSGKSTSSKQIQQFHSYDSKYSFNQLNHVPRIVAGHSYFTENGDDRLIDVRRHLADTATKYGVDYWESEYSMLADGYKEGTKERRTQMDCALFLSKVIYHDLTMGNATAWQFWNAWEPGNAQFDTRYYLIALKPDADYKDGEYTVTKNLWALGNYSRFIRPGMKRLNINRNDGLTAKQIAQDVMIAAFTGGKSKLVLVVTNYTQLARSIKPDLKNFKKISTCRAYVTSANADDNLKPSASQKLTGAINLLPRSITTLVFD